MQAPGDFLGSAVEPPFKFELDIKVWAAVYMDTLVE
jgi:hypothetical protein